MTADLDLLTDGVITQMKALGLTLEEIATRYNDSGVTPTTVREFIDTTVWGALPKGSRIVYRPYIAAIKDGLPGLCTCKCDRCLDHFRGDSQWTPCPCVSGGICNCSFDSAAKGRVVADSCLVSCAVLGDRPLKSITAADWTQLQYWVQTRADKRTEVRNRARALRGQSLYQLDGRCAVEHLHGAISAIYRHAGGEVPGVYSGMTDKLSKQKRAIIQPRSYRADQLEELWSAIFLDGGDDPELDMLIVWTILETGARRGGPIKIEIKNLLFHMSKIGLGEKGDSYVEQPVSEELLRVLLQHALKRGDIIAANPCGIPIDEITLEDIKSRRVKLRGDQPVLYYKPHRGADGAVIPHPLSRKRFETLWKRFREALPWMEEMMARPHDLRKTMGTFVERAFGHAIAQGWLRHAVTDTTGTYTKATAEEIERVRDWITGDLF